jgi:ribonuclease HII
MPGSVNLVDWYDLKDVEVPAQLVKQGDGTSAAMAAASIVAKETRDQLMRGLDVGVPRLRVRGAQGRPSGCDPARWAASHRRIV